MTRTNIRFMSGARCEEPFLSHLILVSDETENHFACTFLCRLGKGADPFAPEDWADLDYCYELPKGKITYDEEGQGCPDCPECQELAKKLIEEGVVIL